MNLIEAGYWPCTVQSAIAAANDRGEPTARITVRIDEGPSAGRVVSYEDVINARSSLYVARSCKAVGWQGQKFATLADDCIKWIATTGGKSTVEIKHIPTKSGRIWDKANSIGRGPKALKPLTTTAAADADQMLRDALAADNASSTDDDHVPF
jgi:hypothetical protein